MMDGKAIVQGFRLEVNRPVTSGGLHRSDIEQLLDVAEVLITIKASSDDERKSKVQEIDNMRAILHYRFDRSCDHQSCFVRPVLLPISPMYREHQ